MDAGKPNKRLRFGQLPVPAERADLYWGKSQPELANVTNGQLTLLLMSTPEFDRVLGPKLDAIDARNRTVGNGKKMGRPGRWTARQLESLLLYRRVAGLETIKRTCERLHFDREAQQLLGFGDKLPSRATITRYLNQHFDQRERASLYRELDRQLRQRVIRLPGFDEEARILGMDGSQHGTRYTPPIPKRNRNGELTGEFINDKPDAHRRITASTAGYVGGTGAKSGKGWQMVAMFTEHGTLVGWDISPLNEYEGHAAERVLDSYEAEILPKRDTSKTTVCSADSGFSSPLLRQRLQELRIVPNIHKASHKASDIKNERLTEKARERNETWRVFQHPGKPHYSNWLGNGHGELRCQCGAGVIKRVIEPGKTKLIIATKGQCESCGNIRVTAGQWRDAQNPKRYVRSYKGEDSDPSVGNPLTFNDPLSRVYGKDRFGFGESVHATIERRFGLLKDKSWMRDITQVEIEFAIAATAISVLLLERQARREGNGTAFEASKPATAEAESNESAELPLAA